MTRRFLVLLAMLLGASASHAQQPVTVFAAASLKGVFDERAAAFERGGGAGARISYGGSLTLARQIDQGAPADVFCAADAESMDWAASRKLIDAGSRVDLVRNALVAIAPAEGPLRSLALTPEGFAQALGDGRLAMGEPASVPAGKYARAALEALGAWPALRGRVASSDNVRAAMLFVARGEAPLGIVYATDARAEPRVRTVATFPPQTHPPIVYPCALARGARNAAAGGAFLDSLRTPESRAAFEAAGFLAAN